MIRLMIILKPAKYKQLWPNLAKVTIKYLGFTTKELTEWYNQLEDIKLLTNNVNYYRVKPRRPRTTAYTVGCLVQDGQYMW